MKQSNLWPTILEAAQALGEHYSPAMDQAVTDVGLPGWYVGLLFVALNFDPEPISAERLRRRAAYTSPRTYAERFSQACGQGYLVPVAGAENEYRLTDLGRQAAQGIIEAIYASMATLQPMPTADLERLAGLLQRLVMACLEAPEPPGKWCLRLSRRTDPGERASVIALIDQYITDLANYRDDAHLASWQPLGVEGQAWEALTFLWSGEAATLDDLVAKLERHGYTREEYGQALASLAQRGWVREEGGQYQVTVLGCEIRQAAEETTDRYFYAPWTCLSQDETEELHTLVGQLGDGLNTG